VTAVHLVVLLKDVGLLSGVLTVFLRAVEERPCMSARVC
jgi:hypothetical protein